MNQIGLIGFGEQGIKAVSEVSSGSCIEVEKYFVDNDLEILKRYASDEKAILSDYFYEGNEWEPGSEIRRLLKDEEMEKAAVTFTQKFSILIFVTGLGGSMSLAAKELADFVKKNCPGTSIYFMCSLPFHEETDYRHNFLARRVLQFLKENQVGWTVIENDRIFQRYYAKLEDAYKNSYMFMTYLLNSLFSLFGSGTWNSKIDFHEIKDLIGRGLVYISVWNDEDFVPENSDIILNEWLPYEPDCTTGKNFMSVGISRGVRIPGLLKRINSIGEKCFSDQSSFSCRIYYKQDCGCDSRIVLATAGMEKSGRNISVREILYLT